MDLRYRATRLVDVARGLRTAKEATARERWPREQLESYREQRLDRLVRFAVQRSPFYGSASPGCRRPVPSIYARSQRSTSTR
jgi:hypothetical protein